MKYVYLDESISQDRNYVGYGALFLSDETYAKQIVEKSLTELINDPDRELKQCKDMDDRTIIRRYFHACEDSKNSHSHFCSSINTFMQGEFFCEVFNKVNLNNEESSTNYLYDLTSGLSSLEIFQTREPIKIIFEERNGLSKPKLEKWLHRYTDHVLASVYDFPYLPAFFPEIEIEIANKSNNGLQCCDFFLWTVMRNLVGINDWYTRLNPKAKFESQPQSGEYNSVHMIFGELKDEDSINYEVNDYPTSGNSVIGINDIEQFYIYAEKLLITLSRNEIPHYLKYMENDIKNFACSTMDKNYVNRIFEVAKIYIKIFDTLPVISSECEPADKKFLLLSKKYMALVLRGDLLNGMRTRTRLENIRKKILKENPQKLSN